MPVDVNHEGDPTQCESQARYPGVNLICAWHREYA